MNNYFLHLDSKFIKSMAHFQNSSGSAIRVFDDGDEDDARPYDLSAVKYSRNKLDKPYETVPTYIDPE